MIALGHILFWLGMLACLIGNLMFLAVVFRSSAIWFVGCLLFPVADVVYFCLNVKQTWKPFLLAFAGWLLAALGYWLGAVNF